MRQQKEEEKKGLQSAWMLEATKVLSFISLSLSSILTHFSPFRSIIYNDVGDGRLESVPYVLSRDKSNGADRDACM